MWGCSGLPSPRVGQMQVPLLPLVTLGHAQTPKMRPWAGQGPLGALLHSNIYAPPSQDNGNDFGIEHEEGLGVRQSPTVLEPALLSSSGTIF